jgi:hypothetical protein
MTRSHSPLATIEHITEDLVVIWLKRDIRIDIRNIQDIAGAVGGHRGQRLSVIVNIPDDTDFDVAILRVDHCASDRIKVMAVVCESGLFQSLVGLYLSYFPQHFPIRVFRRVEESILWLEEHPAHCSPA